MVLSQVQVSHSAIPGTFTLVLSEKPEYEPALVFALGFGAVTHQADNLVLAVCLHHWHWLDPRWFCSSRLSLSMFAVEQSGLLSV